MEYLRVSIASIVLLIATYSTLAQTRIAFYNTENLYDTINNLAVDDGDFSDPRTNDYSLKIEELSSALELIDADILGLCEVENYGVVEELGSSLTRDYNIVHYDSRDSRGIDVALLYCSAKFKLINSELIELDYLWRDPLRVELMPCMGGDKVVIYICHLPSRRGGNIARKLRQKALLDIEHLALSEKTERVIIMGDFNDNPTADGILYNCAYSTFQRGFSSYIYRDTPTMFDQILITPELKRHLVSEQVVLNHSSLINSSGRFKGYPRKGRPSDHLPVYIDINVEDSQ